MTLIKKAFKKNNLLSRTLCSKKLKKKCFAIDFTKTRHKKT